MGKVGCDIWEKWVGGRKKTHLFGRLPIWRQEKRQEKRQKKKKKVHVEADLRGGIWGVWHVAGNTWRDK